MIACLSYMKTSRDIPEPDAFNYFPDGLNYTSLKAAAGGCKGCDLYTKATQTVFGEGAMKAEIMFVGEQPGDEEDLAGHPFVGPAGRLFDKALSEAGIDRKKAYVTNVVKHFNRGKRRLHERPRASEIMHVSRGWPRNLRSLNLGFSFASVQLRRKHCSVKIFELPKCAAAGSNWK